MGVDNNILRLLSESRKGGVSFSSTIMLGRQNFNEDDLKPSDLCNALGITSGEASALLEQKYIEPLLKRLGAARIESLDNSRYEQATMVHDLNQPIPEHLKASFSCVFDGGTTEHIFNYPQAIKNCMEMVAVGGHFLGVTNANNFMGHGFYQFSPELFYRVFSPENGYEVENMILCEADRGSVWYRVKDPEDLGRRVELVNNLPTYIMVVARRVKDVAIFQTTPQQSDYVSAWAIKDGTARSVRQRARGAISVLSKLLPRAIKRSIKRTINTREAFQSDAFQRM
jgi:hypothetical protein